MASILRPFSNLVAPGAYQVPGASVPVIDWTSPLSNGLIGCWLPGVSGGIDLTGNAPTLTPGPNASTTTTRDGVSLKSTNSGGGDGLEGFAPPLYKTANAYTLIWRGAIFGSVLGSNNPTLAGITYDNGGSPPFIIFGFFWLVNIPAFVIAGNNTGTLFSINANLTITNNAVTTIAATWVTASGALLVYQDGVQTLNTTAAGAPSSTATSRINIGGDSIAFTRSTNNGTNIACLWNRALSAGEVLAFHLSPYSFIAPAETDMPILNAASFNPAWAIGRNQFIEGFAS